jgi:general secretion pathway protein M
MNGMAIWWRARTRREQRLLAAMGGMAVLVLAWLLVWRPIVDAVADAKSRHSAAAVALAEARSRASEIETLQKAAIPASGLPPATVVGRSAAAAGFAVASLDEVGGGAVRVTMAAVRPQAFFAWVAEMERKGLIVAGLSARPNADRTVAAEITFRPRRG